MELRDSTCKLENKYIFDKKKFDDLSNDSYKSKIFVGFFNAMCWIQHSLFDTQKDP